MDPTRSLNEVFHDLRDWYGAKKATREALTLCRELAVAVEIAQVFSKNESSEEIPSSDLKFLLLPFYQAYFLSNCDTDDKEVFLNSALSSYEAFLVTLWNYDLCGEDARKWFRDEEALVKGKCNQYALRSQKIERLKREKWIKSEIDRIKAQEADEEHERGVWLLELELCFMKALTDRDMVRKELELIQYAAKEKPEVDKSDTKNETLCLLNAFARRLMQRDTLKQKVFRPSHILPTMTPEQFAEIECRNALERQKQDKPEIKLTDEDEQVQRDRAWDDWKDDNPRGCGNSSLKPCS